MANFLHINNNQGISCVAPSNHFRDICVGIVQYTLLNCKCKIFLQVSYDDNILFVIQGES